MEETVIDHARSSPPSSLNPSQELTSNPDQKFGETVPDRIRIKNRRKYYLTTHPSYFQNPSLELADPLLYDRLIRRFQSAAEREAEGRKKGYSGILEADIMRGEAKLDALANPDPNIRFNYRRGENGEILAEEEDEIPVSKEEGLERWKWEMEMRFVEGRDADFEYETVDLDESMDDLVTEERERAEKWFDEEEEGWVGDDDHGGNVEGGERQLKGETGIQDF